MATRGEVQVFSLSFLDLIFCAMAGILVLYAIADPAVPPKPPAKRPPPFVQVRFPGSAKGIVYCVEFLNGEKHYFGNSLNDDSPWLFDRENLVARLRLDEPVESGARLVVWIFDLPVTKPEMSNVALRVEVIDPSSGTFVGSGAFVRKSQLTAPSFRATFQLK